MTTRVTIDAHAGWPVDVTRISNDGAVREPAVRVEPHTQADFHVWAGSNLLIHEVQPGESTIDLVKADDGAFVFPTDAEVLH